MRVFVYDFITSPFLNQDIQDSRLAYFLYESLLDKSGFSEEEVDLVYFFGIERKEVKEYFFEENNSFLCFENKTSSVLSNFFSACDLLKSNKANVIFLISITQKIKENPFLEYKNLLLNTAKEYGITKPLLDEFFIKSYHKFEYFYQKELHREDFQPLLIKGKLNEIFAKDFFFYNGIIREKLNLSKLLSSTPWEIFSEYHFAQPSTGGSAIVLVNEEMARERNLKNLSEIGFFNFLNSKKNIYPMNLFSGLSQTRDFNYKVVFSSAPCILFEALTRSFFSNTNLQKEYLGSSIIIEELNPFGSDIFTGWAEGSNFLRRVGFLRNFLLDKKGKGLLIENLPSGPDFFMEISV